ncbi:MAG: AAA family ATPase [Acidobacteriota bacterium]|nr:AAA family ATPase [Blastocatellia bacterium]MDW8411840.1 AAA family ATPase [Acidobacteriota bacterium]
MDIEFEPTPSISPLTWSEFTTTLERLGKDIGDLTAPEGKGDVLGATKTTLLKTLTQLKNSKSASNPTEVVSKAEVQSLINAIASQANEEWQRQTLQSIKEEAEEMLKRASFQENLNRAKKWIEENLPKFIYFDRYDVIDSAVHLPSFVHQLNQQPVPPRVRTTRCLFEYVGLDIQHLASLGRHHSSTASNETIRRYVDERAIYLSSASSAMTRKFQDWWEQRRHKFHYQVDGDFFRIWVSDDLDDSEIELDQRSLGMQYFFSFFTVFLAEAKDAHQKAILLLDEPGLHMHGTAQAKVVKFLEKLAQDNQTMYTTHSPFMIDADHLERIRVVYEDKDGTTKVSEDVWPRDKDALFPLQAALGYQLVQSLFIAKRQLIVEGPTDYSILKAFNQAIRQRGETSLRDDVIIVPSGGLSKLLPLASMLIGHTVEVVALLDGDEPGRKEGNKLTRKLLAGEAGRCLFIGDFLEGKPEAELEDIFPEEVYLEAVREAYSLQDLGFGEEENAKEGVVNKVKTLFERRSLGQFEKWLPAAVLRDWITSKPEKFPDAVWQTVTQIFEAVNKAFNANISKELGYGE